MKKYLIIIVSFVIVLFLTSCSEPVSDEVTTVHEEASSEIQAEHSSYDMNFAEDFSSELKEPDFAFPRHFSEIEQYMELPEYDSMVKEGTDEKYSDKGVLVYVKSYIDKSLASVSVYESDGTTVAALYEYLYNDDGTTAVDIDYYKNGEKLLRRKFTFFNNGVIKSIYNMTVNPESGAPVVDTYEFNENGDLVVYIDSESFNQILIDAILNGLADG